MRWTASACGWARVRASVLTTVAVVSLVPVPISGQGQTATADAWTAPRTPWGDPDLQGTWTNVTATPLERPEALEGKQVLTDEELAERERHILQEFGTDTVPPAGSAGSHNEYWRERGRLISRTSLLVDPADGKLPPFTLEGRRIQDQVAAAWRTSATDGPESRDLFERCITRGLPGAMMGNFYNHNYLILQTRGYVGDSPRDDPRRPDHSTRWPAACESTDRPMVGGLAGSMGRRDARRRDDQLTKRP